MNSVLDTIDAYTENYSADRFTNLDALWRGLVNWPNSYYKWLWAAVSVLQPQEVVEIGRERGVSTSIILDALGDGNLTSIDIVQESLFLNSISDSRLTLITMDSLDAAEIIPNGIDFLFIDGEHTKEQVEKEWKLYRPKMAPKSIIVFDDIHFNEGMTEFWNSLQEDKYDISRWHEPGFGVVFIND